MKSEREVAQLYPTLSDPMDCSLPGPSVHGIFQARVLEWGAIAFSVLSLYRWEKSHASRREAQKGTGWVEGWREPATALIPSLLAGGGQGPPVLLCPEDIPSSCPVLFQPCLSSCPEGGGGRASLSWGPRRREWEIDGETVETVSDFVFGGSKITADGDCKIGRAHV